MSNRHDSDFFVDETAAVQERNWSIERIDSHVDTGGFDFWINTPTIGPWLIIYFIVYVSS